MSALVNTMFIDSAAGLWELCRQSIRERMEAERSEQAFHTWIEPLQLDSVDQGTVTFRAGLPIQKDWVERNYSSLLLSTLQKLDPSIVALRFFVDPKGGQRTVENILLPELRVPLIPASKATPPKTVIASKTANASASAPVNIADPLQARFTFPEFVPGPCNRLAYDLCREVAANPGYNNCNPLVLYGGSGLGKTHLLQAVAHQAMSLGTTQSILYCSSDRLLKDWHRMASRSREFYSFYASADLLLVDDIQFLAPARAAQNELVNLIKHLVARKRQVVLTCDKLPQEVGNLQENLLRETDNGVAIALERPDLEVRLAILRRKLGGNSLNEEVIRWIAHHHDSNVRQMEGVITRILAYRDLLDEELDLEHVKGWLADPAREQGNLSIPRISEAVALRFGLASDLLCSRAQSQAISLPRKIAMYLCRRLTGASLKTIGLHFRRDYSTVMASVDWVTETILTDEALKQTIQDMQAEIES